METHVLNMNKNGKQSYHFQLSWGFQDPVDSALFWDFVAFPNETSITYFNNKYFQVEHEQII